MSDLVPREPVEKWLKYLREELPAVAFKCNTQQQKSNLAWKSTKASKSNKTFPQTSDCLGAEALMKLLNNYTRSHEVFHILLYALFFYDHIYYMLCAYFVVHVSK